MSFHSQSTKLIDCTGRVHVGPRDSGTSPYRELFLVEGDSASQAVARVRDDRFQAVLPMQGKPMNASKSSDAAVRRNQWFRALIDALGCDWNATDLDSLRYDRVLFLFDPDADGIHCGVLMMLFFDVYLGPLVDNHRVSLIKAPMYEIRASGYRDSLQAYGVEHRHQIEKALDQKGIRHRHQRYRGLASLNDDVLHETCVAPDSRTAYLLQKSDIDEARQVFCSPRKPV